MSGGSLDYVYGKLKMAIEEIENRAESDLERKFILHLEKISTALHDLEWFYSGDYNETQAMESIKKVFESDDEQK